MGLQARLVRDRGQESPPWERGLPSDQVAVGRRADICLAGSLSDPQPGLRAEDLFERGAGADQHDPADAPAAFRREARGPLPLSSSQEEHRCMRFMEQTVNDWFDSLKKFSTTHRAL